MMQTAIAGLTPPDLAEVRVREVFPSVARYPGVASLGRMLTGTIVLAPLAWLLMFPFYFGKLAPIIGRRYTLTNRRVMIRHGLSATPGQSVSLAEIDEVRLVTDANSTFFRAATLEIISQGRVALSMPGVPEADCFRQAILNTRNAWVSGKASKQPFIAASVK
ncbi:MAG: PH domain-containing protein [Planctomycetes bacterium]|nr:PH domain-containing protein [Planctomycetota bacterium]